MRRRAAFPLLALLGALLGVLLLLVPRPSRAGAEVRLAVIVSPRSKLREISLSDLRRVFESERLTDPDGNRLIAFNHPPKTVDRVGFDQAVLHLDAEAVARFWIDRKIRGGSGPPQAVDSLSTLRRVVQKLPGALGYVRPEQLTSEVRAIRVDGKLPEQAGYALHFAP